MATRILPRQSRQTADMHFPLAGIDLSTAFGKQPAREVDHGVYARTTPVAQNVRGFDAVGQRLRGGQRPGLTKYVAAAVGGISGWVVQELNVITSGSANVQLSQSGRAVTLVAVQQGNIYTANAGDASWTTATNLTGDSPALNFTGVMYSAANIQKLWFADGVNWVYYQPSDNTVNRWTPGTTDLAGNAIVSKLPVDSDGNTPRLICTWRGRTVLSGLLKDPQNWFMSAVNDPRNFDYSPLSTTPSQAIAGSNAPQGLIGDVVTALIPHSDDVLIFGGDHTIYAMRGDPMAGGQISLVSDAIGIAWGQAWCKDPYGNIYFVSNRMGIYMLDAAVPGNRPQRISQSIEQLILPVDTGANAIRLIWDDKFQGLHVFITLLAEPGATTHLFYEQRTGAWWTDVFGNTNHNPLAVCTFDGNDPNDRRPLLGGWDGYVRFLDPDATDDDGTVIESEVVIGPILNWELDDFVLHDLQTILGDSSGSVQYGVLVGATAETALASTARYSGTWKAGRNLLSNVRAAGHAIYVDITGVAPWQMESIRAVISTHGKIRKRGA